MRVHRLAFILLCVAHLCACIGHQQYRTDYTLCASAAEPACAVRALHEHTGADSPAQSFLGFIEFDDQGQLWDRAQMYAIVNHLIDQLPHRDLIVLVYAHGWKHSAAPGDGDIGHLQDILTQLSEVEARTSAEDGREPRQVAGVYLGWRGGSVSLPVLKELSFWDRKSTAHEVGRGGVLEVLARLEELPKLRESLLVDPNEPPPTQPLNRTRLAVVGHSFGGALVYSALEHVLEERFVQTTASARTTDAARGFGDLVVLINPAFEALRFASLRDMSTERGHYFPQQKPVLAILTSESDDSTRVAFPLGRFFSTLFEREREVTRPGPRTGVTEQIDEDEANSTAIGHFKPYRTHRLKPAGEAAAPEDADKLAQHFASLKSAWQNDQPGGSISFPGTALHRLPTTASRNPYLIVRVDEEIIPDHSDIHDPRVTAFLEQLILLSTEAP